MTGQSGEYYLTGVMETGCGIKLNEDGSFEFFYSYGALDRHGYGTWKLLSENEIELNTNYEGLIPFSIILEEKRSSPGIKIFIPNYNQMLQRNTTIAITGNGTKEEVVADENGIFNFNSTTASEIVVTCIFYFDNPATLIPLNSTSNYLELAPNHHLPLVHFDHAKFEVAENTLTGNLHLIDDYKKYRFEK
ncbi:MAG: hypothetical protein ACHQFW_09025 [Chitinophagales bacterium]